MLLEQKNIKTVGKQDVTTEDRYGLTFAMENKLGKKEERKLKMRTLLVYEEADPSDTAYVLRRSVEDAVSGLEEAIII